MEGERIMKPPVNNASFTDSENIRYLFVSTNTPMRQKTRGIKVKGTYLILNVREFRNWFLVKL